MVFDFDPEKNNLLKETRDISFEEVIEEIENGDNVLDIVPHFNIEKYPHQNIFIIKINNYVYYIPFVEDNNKCFLKNIIPSRKLNKTYNS